MYSVNYKAKPKKHYQRSISDMLKENKNEVMKYLIKTREVRKIWVEKKDNKGQMQWVQKSQILKILIQLCQLYIKHINYKIKLSEYWLSRIQEKEIYQG